MTSIRISIRVLLLLSPVVVLASIWYPVYRQYQVGSIDVSERLVYEARHLPQDNLLRELSGYDAGLTPPWESPAQTILSAEKLFRGEVDIPGVPLTQIRFPFQPRDLEEGFPDRQLRFAGMVPTKVLLDAYRASGRDAFLTAARDTIVKWDDFERKAWLPRGLLWNDHAVASRAYVLVDFWSVYRDRAEGDLLVSKAVLRMADRYGRLLSKADNFTYATNHGIMQNLALWHLALAFPSLPGTAGRRDLALERLRDQMGFYISREGVILEHSAGYQQYGLELLGLMFRYFILEGIPVPPDWADKYREAIDFYGVLRRPDGSLPNYGDTNVVREPSKPKVSGNYDTRKGQSPSYRHWYSRPRPITMKPVSGYVVWWDGLDCDPTGRAAAQTVALWSYFPGHAHKHSDEMSIVHWAGGRAWWTHTGDWPYGVPGRKNVEGWEGSNAPHFVGERARSSRTTTMKYSVWTHDFALIDLVREGPGGYVVRRQLVRASPALWAVIDASSGADEKRTVRVWTAPYDTRILEGKSPGSFRIEAPGNVQALQGWVLGSEGLTVRTFRGSVDPFAGWEVIDSVPLPAPAIEVSQRANDSWAAIVWISPEIGGNGFKGTGTPVMKHWDGAEDWDLELPVGTAPVRIERRGNRVIVSGLPGKNSSQVVRLEPGPDVEAQRRELRSALEASAHKYSIFRDYLPYRFRLSALVLGLLVIQETVLLVIRRKGWGEAPVLQYLAVAGWVILEGGVIFFYLVI